MKKILFIFPLLMSLSVSAQFSNPIYSDWDSGYSIGVYGRYQLATNAITSNFAWDVYQGKVLSRDLREGVSSKMSNTNRLGADIDFGLYAKHLPDSAKGIGWFLNISDRSHANAKIPKDLFDMVLFGNAMFAGKTAQLAEAKLTFLSYKQYEIGILKQIAKEKGTWNIGFGVSLLTGNRSLDVSIDRASLYTAIDGEYLEGEVQGDIRSSSLSSAQYFDLNGIGFSTSLQIGYEAGKFGIRLVAEDLGIINWSKNLEHTELDSSFVFEGIEVDLFSTNGNPFSSLNLDTIVAGFATEKEGSKYTSVIPGSLRLEGFYSLNSKKWKLYAGVHYRFAPAYFPYMYVGTSSPLKKGFFIDGRFAYGGFGSWNIGLELRKKFAEVLEIHIGSNNLEGYLLPMVGTSQSAYIGIAGFF